MDFFRSVIKELNGKLLFAELGKEAIGSLLSVPFKDRVYYVLYSGVNDQYRHLRPTDLLFWHVIKRACLNGFKYVDFGRTDKADKGLIFFKEKWASRSEALRYYYLPRSSFVSSRSGLKFHMVNTFFKKLPISIARVLGPPLIKRLG